MKRLAIIIALIIVFSKVSSAFGGPQIDDFSGTAFPGSPINNGISSGGSIIISGSSFGSNSAVGTNDLQSLGDNIENGTVGDVLSATGWSNRYGDIAGTQTEAKYSNTQAHSGSNSIALDYTDAWRGHLYWEHGSAIRKVYISFWVYADIISGNGQWKIWRIKASNGNDGCNFVDDSLNFIQNCWGNDIGRIAVLYVTGSYPSPSYNPDGRAFLNVDEVPGPGAIEDRWVRMEYYFDIGTRGNSDGTLEYNLHDPDDTTPAIRTPSNLQHNGDLRFLYSSETDSTIWENILIGGYTTEEALSMIAYYDDIYIQVGTRARVEIGNASAWEDCTHREIQVPIAWDITGELIEVTVNRGSFVKYKTAYLFVVDSKGNASAGVPVVFLMDTVKLKPVEPGK